MNDKKSCSGFYQMEKEFKFARLLRKQKKILETN